ncbi:hypothetical protein HHUSO_G23081 [Huso huso]|uniref:SET domain-containing protein n=1 Tax=Huso huso TaxID=61971 RepID=A0ABR0YVJ9_HUSHU
MKDECSFEDDSYVFELMLGRRTLWIDASVDDGSYARLINDNHQSPNLIVKLVNVDGVPYAAFFAARNIEKGEEIEYNYGGPSHQYWWRKQNPSESYATVLADEQSAQSESVENGIISETSQVDLRRDSSSQQKSVVASDCEFEDYLSSGSSYVPDTDPEMEESDDDCFIPLIKRTLQKEKLHMQKCSDVTEPSPSTARFEEIHSNLSSQLYHFTKYSANINKNTAKIMKATYLIEDQDQKAEGIDKFVSILNMRWPSVFGDAEYAVVKSGQEKLRKPAQLPFESDIERVRKYTVQKTKSLLNEEYLMWGESEYKELCDLVVSRLTHFNERRGGEPSRMLLTEWKDAESGVWIDENAAENISNPVEKALLGKYKIAFQAGKGSKHLVPVLIPNDCLEALRKLSNSDIRKEAGVNPLNQFLFPYTRKSEDHVSGWHAVNEICKAAKISNKITATKMRHRASTIY